MSRENRWVSLARRGLDESCMIMNITIDNSMLAIEFTRAGFGLCFVQQYYAETCLDQGDLVTPLSQGSRSRKRNM